MRARSIVSAAAAVSFLGTVLLSVQTHAQKEIGPSEETRGSTRQSDADFYAATNEVLQEMGKILDLPPKSTLHETIRTKDEIRRYLIDEQNKEESPEKRYVDRRTLEAFGLIPKGFPLDSFLLDLLTDQVAGLYDPQTKEFFIASWIAPGDQKEVMAHELTHALDDQYFHLKKWQNAVRSNDDASLARDAVIEGSALAAMMDYTLADMHTSVRELSDIAPFIESSVADQMDKDPNLAKAPPFVRDELLFPYLEGAKFTQKVLKATGSWAGFQEVFKNPPASTQEILHPDLYFQKVVPERVRLPNLKSAMPRGYIPLDENVVGEFALSEVLKQFLGPGDAELYAPMWRGDRYVLFENKATKQTILVVLLALDSETDTRSFFAAYRKALEEKDSVKAPVREGQEFVAFNTVSLACVGTQCLSLEGANRSVFDRIEHRLGWPAEARTNHPTASQTPLAATGRSSAHCTTSSLP